MEMKMKIIRFSCNKWITIKKANENYRWNVIYLRICRRNIYIS